MNFFTRRGFALFLSLVGAVGAAQAQRTGVPVVEFRDIPVSLATQKSLTAEQVRQAIQVTATAERWDMVTLADGSLQLTTLKNGKHTVVMNMTYSASTYSLLYKSSDKLNYSKNVIQRPTNFGIGPINVIEDARLKQIARFSALPESKYAVALDDTLIHPSYEAWLHELLSGVRRQLSVL
ncbi:MAG: hypothetical protein RLZZ618_4199 [Pseudomonadota bacterium]